MIRKGSYVRLRRSGVVYEVVRVFPPSQGRPEARYEIDSTAKHPKAAKRVPDAFRFYTADELYPVTSARTPR